MARSCLFATPTDRSYSQGAGWDAIGMWAGLFASLSSMPTGGAPALLPALYRRGVGISRGAPDGPSRRAAGTSISTSKKISQNAIEEVWTHKQGNCCTRRSSVAINAWLLAMRICLAIAKNSLESSAGRNATSCSSSSYGGTVHKQEARRSRSWQAAEVPLQWRQDGTITTADGPGRQVRESSSQCTAD